MPRKPLLGPELLTHQLKVHQKEVVLVRGIVEASEGVGVVFAERGGDLTLAGHKSLAKDFEKLVEDLVSEFGITRTGE